MTSGHSELIARLLTYCSVAAESFEGSEVRIVCREAAEAISQLEAERDEAVFLLDEGGAAYRAISDLEASKAKLADLLDLQNHWVAAALNCKDWEWDSDQRAAAEDSLRRALEALA